MRFLAIGLTVFMLAVGASAQMRTVTDYFLAFPDDLYSTDAKGDRISGKAAITKHRRSLIKIEDVKNGYLRLEGAWEGWAEIALFKKKDGSYIVGHTETGCGPACSGFIEFYRYAGGKWTTVTEDVFSEPEEASVLSLMKENEIDPEMNGSDTFFMLPRVGTTVKLACNLCKDSDEPFTLREFSWNGESFVAKP